MTSLEPSKSQEDGRILVLSEERPRLRSKEVVSYRRWFDGSQPFKIEKVLTKPCHIWPIPVCSNSTKYVASVGVQ